MSFDDAKWPLTALYKCTAADTLFFLCVAKLLVVSAHRTCQVDSEAMASISTIVCMRLAISKTFVLSLDLSDDSSSKKPFTAVAEIADRAAYDVLIT